MAFLHTDYSNNTNIFWHTDLTELTDFIRFIRGAKNILWDIDERVVCGNWIHGIDGIGMRCDT